MTYTWLAIAAVVLSVVLDGWVLRTNLLRHKGFWASYAIIVFFQLITNGLLTGLPIVTYDPGAILGAHLVYAPVEDLLFGFAMVVVTLSLWVRLGARATPSAGR